MYLTTRQCSEISLASDWVVRYWCRTGYLQRQGVTVRRAGRSWRVDEKSFRAWVDREVSAS